MDVSIIVVAWNVRELLLNCLESVYQGTRDIEFEVIYVDNGSTDGSVERVREKFPKVRILENKENLGFIRANNQAIEVAQGRYVLLLNSDTLVLDNVIGKTVAFADQNPGAAVVGCRVLNPDRTLQRNCFRFYSTLNMLLDALFLRSLFPRHPLFGRKLYGDWKFDSVREVDVVVGCYSLVRMEAIRQVGVMDEIFFVYGDDIDWCYRFVKAGWKVMFAPVGEIIHYGGQTTRQARSKFALQLYGAYLINVKKHYSALTFWGARLLTATYFLLRAAFWSLRAPFPGKSGAMARASAGTFFTAVYYCLFDWKGMLINRAAVEGRL
ncbi:MAG: glycosyltransferase family 2 protein [Verrucomicrobiae bacterium]|nr:glycosyltransferase family 2 protein [Verrucomicrobiae bacterium]